MFNLSPATLRRLLEINSFPEPTDDHELVFFGLRGCLPRDPDDQRFADGHDLELAEVSYVQPRCTLLQWRPETEEIAVFPGTASALKIKWENV